MHLGPHGRQLGVHIGPHAVAADDHLIAVGHLGGGVHRHHALGGQVGHALGVVDQRPQGGHLAALFHQPVGELHRTVHAKAEPGGFCKQDLHGALLNRTCSRRTVAARHR